MISGRNHSPAGRTPASDIGAGALPPEASAPPPRVSRESIGWVQTFRARHGRAPSILHLGNIANNAYNNAKIQRAVGFDCDVLCNDYYHIMGCPEWEDSDFEGDLGDQFRPTWHRVDLGGFQRPRWFAQGRLGDCLDYLLARRDGRGADTDRLWCRLQGVNGTAAPAPLVRAGIEAEQRWLDFKNWLHRQRRPRAAGALPMTGDAEANPLDTLAVPTGRPGGFSVVRAALVESLLTAYAGTKMAARGAAFRLRDPAARGVGQRLAGAFQEAFPMRPDRLSPVEVLYPAAHLRRWRALLSRYDLVQAYGTHVIFPMLAEVPFVAFEHGTLREIPFEDTPVGRLTALGYHRAQVVLVTNSDCLDNARALASGPVCFVNHPYDEDHGLGIRGVETLRAELELALDADFLVFFPTRQDWVPGTGFADKANDVLLRAFGRLRAMGHREGLVCCEWGRNVEESRRLLESLGVSAHVHWTAPMGMVRFDRHVAASDVAADQFKIGAFGGVLFKAMSVGVPVCTYLEEAVIGQRYPEVPPVLNCRDVASVVRALTALITDPARREDFAARGRGWIKRHHSAAEVVAAQAGLYARLCLPPVEGHSLEDR